MLPWTFHGGMMSIGSIFVDKLLQFIKRHLVEISIEIPGRNDVILVLSDVLSDKRSPIAHKVFKLL